MIAAKTRPSTCPHWPLPRRARRHAGRKLVPGFLRFCPPPRARPGRPLVAEPHRERTLFRYENAQGCTVAANNAFGRLGLGDGLTVRYDPRYDAYIVVTGGAELPTYVHVAIENYRRTGDLRFLAPIEHILTDPAAVLGVNALFSEIFGSEDGANRLATALVLLTSIEMHQKTGHMAPSQRSAPRGNGSSLPTGLRSYDEVGITPAQAQRIQNAANRIGKPIIVVGSRARSAAGHTSDWDYIIPGINNAEWKKIKNSLPGAPDRVNGSPRQIDVLSGPVDPNSPHVIFDPTGG